MPQITLNLTDEEYQKYLAGLAMAQSLNFDNKKILIIFNSPGCQIPMVRCPLPEPAKLRRNGLEFDSRTDYETHRRFYRQAMADIDQILNAGGQP